MDNRWLIYVECILRHSVFSSLNTCRQPIPGLDQAFLPKTAEKWNVLYFFENKSSDRQTPYLYVHVIFVAYCSGAASALLTPRQVLGLLVNDTVFNAYLTVKYHLSGICPTCFSKPVICFQIHSKLGDVPPKPRLSDHNRCNYVRLYAPLQIPRTAETYMEPRNLIIRIL